MRSIPTHATGYPSAPRWLTVFVPLVVYPVLFASAYLAPSFYEFMQRKEGTLEYMAVLVLLLGVAHGVLLMKRYRRAFPAKWLRWWFGISTVGMIVLTGEEISWGQHLGLFTSADLPDPILAVNDQNELNFHNITNALDQGPTNVVVLGVFVAFVILPIVQRIKKQTMDVDNPGYWFWPTRAGLIAAIGVLLIPFPKRIYEWVTGQDGPNELRHSEIHEFYIALLMTIYMVDAYRRARAVCAAKRERSAARAAAAASGAPALASVMATSAASPAIGRSDNGNNESNGHHGVEPAGDIDEAPIVTARDA